MQWRVQLQVMIFYNYLFNSSTCTTLKIMNSERYHQNHWSGLTLSLHEAVIPLRDHLTFGAYCNKAPESQILGIREMLQTLSLIGNIKHQSQTATCERISIISGTSTALWSRTNFALAGHHHPQSSPFPRV
jgi:hypothetical protein